MEQPGLVGLWVGDAGGEADEQDLQPPESSWKAPLGGGAPNSVPIVSPDLRGDRRRGGEVRD